MIYVLRQWKDGQTSGLVQHLERHQVPFQILEAYSMQHEHYPHFSRGDAVIGLGGPPSVCRLREADYETPFLLDEERFIQAAERDGVPFLGICLAHQLRARMADQDVLNGTLVFGVQPVNLTSKGTSHWLFDSLPTNLMMYQNHCDYVVSLPDSADLLATSPTCGVEAAAWSDMAVTVQFHPEVLGSQYPWIMERFASTLVANGISAAEMLARVPANYDQYTARLFDNFLYRAGYIRRPEWRQQTVHAVAA